MLKYNLILYLIFTIILIFALNKFVGFKDQLENKVLGSYYTQMEAINRELGMDVYNLERQTYSEGELKELEKLSIY